MKLLIISLFLVVCIHSFSQTRLPVYERKINYIGLDTSFTERTQIIMKDTIVYGRVKGDKWIIKDTMGTLNTLYQMYFELYKKQICDAATH